MLCLSAIGVGRKPRDRACCRLKRGAFSVSEYYSNGWAPAWAHTSGAPRRQKRTNMKFGDCCSCCCVRVFVCVCVSFIRCHDIVITIAGFLSWDADDPGAGPHRKHRFMCCFCLQPILSETRVRTRSSCIAAICEAGRVVPRCCVPAHDRKAVRSVQISSAEWGGVRPGFEARYSLLLVKVYASDGPPRC